MEMLVYVESCCFLIYLISYCKKCMFLLAFGVCLDVRQYKLNSRALTQLLTDFTDTGNKDMSNLTSTLTFANNYVGNDAMANPGCSSQDSLDSKDTHFFFTNNFLKQILKVSLPHWQVT